MNKKGAYTIEQMVLWIVYIIVFIFVAANFYYSISGIAKRETDVSNAVNNIYSKKFLEDGDCLAFSFGEVKKTGILDVNKFNSDILNNCLKRRGFSAKLTLNYNNKTLIAFNDEDTYSLDSRLCFSSKYKCKSKEFYTVIKDSDKLYNASLHVSVVLNVA